MRHTAWIFGLGALALGLGCGGGGGGGNQMLNNGGDSGGSGGGGTGGNDPDNDRFAGTNSECRVMDRSRLTNEPGASVTPSIQWNGSSYLVLWSDARGGSADIYGMTLDRMGRPSGAGHVVASTTNEARSPRAAVLSNGQAVAFYEECLGFDGRDCGGGRSVMAVRLGQDGRPAGAPVEVSPAAAVQRRPEPVAAFNRVYVGFRDLSGDRRVQARVIGLDASTLAPSGQSVTLNGGGEGHYPYLAVNGNHLAVSYVKGGTLGEVALALFDQGLNARGEQVVRTGVSGTSHNPVTAWTGRKWAVAWEDLRGGGDEQLYTALVEAGGDSVDGNQLVLGDVGNWPAIASNGKQAVIAFYAFPAGAQIVVANIDANGRRKGEPMQVTRRPMRARFPSLTHNSATGDFGLVWQDDESQDIHFARLRCD